MFETFSVTTIDEVYNPIGIGSIVGPNFAHGFVAAEVKRVNYEVSYS